MKYIVTKRQDGTEELFVFPKSIHHRDMAEAVEMLREHDRYNPDKWTWIQRQPVSAGFVENGKCVGNSESLQLVSRPEDTVLLSRTHPST